MLTGFTAGLAVTFFGIAAMIFAEFPYTVMRPFAFLTDFRRYWEFALVGFFYNAGIGLINASCGSRQDMW
jgi:uncharacterized membrane protein